MSCPYDECAKGKTCRRCLEDRPQIREDPLVKFVPCPYCQETRTHKGTCELSNMRTGKHIVIMAVEATPEEQLLDA